MRAIVNSFNHPKRRTYIRYRHKINALSSQHLIAPHHQRKRTCICGHQLSKPERSILMIQPLPRADMLSQWRSERAWWGKNTSRGVPAIRRCAGIQTECPTAEWYWRTQGRNYLTVAFLYCTPDYEAITLYSRTSHILSCQFIYHAYNATVAFTSSLSYPLIRVREGLGTRY